MDETETESTPETLLGTPVWKLTTWVKGTREESARRSTPENRGDLPPVVSVLRDGHLVASVFCEHVDRDEGLKAARLCAAGFEADELWLLMDTHMSTQATKPDGSKWEGGDMQRLCDETDACSTGLITDAMTLFMGSRAGAMAMLALPYHAADNYKQVHWNDDAVTAMEANGDGSSFMGFVVESLTEAFGLPSARSLILENLRDPESSLPWTPRGRLYDCLSLMALASEGYAVVVSSTGPEDFRDMQRWIDELGLDPWVTLAI